MYIVTDLNNDFVGYTNNTKEIKELKEYLNKTFGKNSSYSISVSNIIPNNTLIEQYKDYLIRDGLN